MSSASRSASPRRSTIPRVASSSPTPRRCRAILTTATRCRPSSPRSRRRSAPAFRASSPIAATAATTRRPIIASRSMSRGRSGASPNRSSASCAAGPPSNPSSATPKASIGWAAIISPFNKATRSTPSSPPPDTTSEDCWPGWRSCCSHCCSPSREPRHHGISPSPSDLRSSRTTK
jgi:hypothetical protein